MARRLNVRSVMRKYGIRPKRQWSQNFLVDLDVLESIAAAACEPPPRAVVELGAGFGALTAMLARLTGKVVALERDRDLAAVLRREFAGDPAVQVVEDNAARVDFRRLVDPLGDGVAVVGNLPYHMAAPILFHLIDSGTLFCHWILMFQKEMADRLASGPGSRAYGAISVLAQQHCRIEPVLEVSPEAFFPVPKVRSRVLRIRPRGDPQVAVRNHKTFVRVVKGAFSQRRKKLRNSLLAAFSGQVGREGVDRALGQSGVDGGLRAEQLTIGMFASLADAFDRLEGGGSQ